jgi:hypothetical protein
VFHRDRHPHRHGGPALALHHAVGGTAPCRAGPHLAIWVNVPAKAADNSVHGGLSEAANRQDALPVNSSCSIQRLSCCGHGTIPATQITHGAFPQSAVPQSAGRVALSCTHENLATALQNSFIQRHDPISDLRMEEPLGETACGRVCRVAVRELQCQGVRAALPRRAAGPWDAAFPAPQVRAACNFPRQTSAAKRIIRLAGRRPRPLVTGRATYNSCFRKVRALHGRAMELRSPFCL